MTEPQAVAVAAVYKQQQQQTPNKKNQQEESSKVEEMSSSQPGNPLRHRSDPCTATTPAAFSVLLLPGPPISFASATTDIS